MAVIYMFGDRHSNGSLDFHHGHSSCKSLTGEHRVPAYYSEFLYGVNMTVGFYRFQGLMCPIVIQHWLSKVCYNGYMNMGFGA